ncbi:meiotically up-regulated gene 113-domain-containing protein [Aspergillus crustosus]
MSILPRSTAGSTKTKPRQSFAGQHGHPIPPRQPRTSIDTLMDRLGVLEITDPQQASNSIPAKPKPQYTRKKKRTKSTFCCFTIIEDDEPLPSRPKPRPHQPGNPAPRPPQQMHQIQRPAHPIPPPTLQSKPTSKPVTPTQTTPLLSWIPPSLTPQTTSLLLAELVKPIAVADEPGYIYMFWITPSNSPKSPPPPIDIASSLLPSADRGLNAIETPDQIRRTDTAIWRARDLNQNSTSLSRSNPATSGAAPGLGPGTVRLKIGRTSNVHRRLNEWTRQCSNHLTLIRYYPYTSSSSPSSSSSMSSAPSRPRSGKGGTEPGKKVPHVHRVERLIHIELADFRARDLGACQECGKEHREWFEVAAERTALKRVDECIRRWVQWAQTQE